LFADHHINNARAAKTRTHADAPTLARMAEIFTGDSITPIPAVLLSSF
jgi:hypothetical protein